eukprot:c4787_g1_i1.p1 GENE.c4787_g1_i1~~c4787_g1_i1.p1  ORF type:complete len:475 (+),score=88.69 c4787_g1_i1:187-1425(+)
MLITLAALKNLGTACHVDRCAAVILSERYLRELLPILVPLLASQDRGELKKLAVYTTKLIQAGDPPLFSYLVSQLLPEEQRVIALVNPATTPAAGPAPIQPRTSRSGLPVAVHAVMPQATNSSLSSSRTTSASSLPASARAPQPVVPPVTAPAPIANTTSSSSGRSTTTTATTSRSLPEEGQIESLIVEVTNKCTGSIDERQQALRKIHQWTKDKRVAHIVWNEANAARILIVMLDMFAPIGSVDEYTIVRDHLLSVVHALLEFQPHRLPVDFHRPLLLRLIESCTETSRETALRCLGLLLNIMEPKACLEELVPMIDGEDNFVVQAAIDCLTKVVPRFNEVEVKEILPSTLPPLLVAFRSPSADVRKAVVLALVAMYQSIGKDMMPHLSQLNPSQLKLVQIYIERQKQPKE